MLWQQFSVASPTDTRSALSVKTPLNKNLLIPHKTYTDTCLCGFDASTEFWFTQKLSILFIDVPNEASKVKVMTHFYLLSSDCLAQDNKFTKKEK